MLSINHIQQMIESKKEWVSDQKIVKGAYIKAKEILGEKYNKTQCMLIGYRFYKGLPITKELIEKDMIQYELYKSEQKTIEAKKILDQRQPIKKEVYRNGKILECKAIDLSQFYSIAIESLKEDIETELDEMSYSEVKSICMMEESDTFSYDGVDYDIQVNVSYKNGSSVTSITAINKSTNEKYYDSHVL